MPIDPWRNAGSGALARDVDEGGELADVAQVRLLEPRFLDPFLLRIIRLFVLGRQVSGGGVGYHEGITNKSGEGLNLNAAQNVVILLCDAHQLLFAAVFVQGLGRRQRLLHVHSLGMRHDMRHALQQQIIRSLDRRVALFVKLLTLQILKGEADT